MAQKKRDATDRDRRNRSPPRNKNYDPCEQWEKKQVHKANGRQYIFRSDDSESEGEDYDMEASHGEIEEEEFRSTMLAEREDEEQK